MNITTTRAFLGTIGAVLACIALLLTVISVQHHQYSTACIDILLMCINLYLCINNWSKVR